MAGRDHGHAGRIQIELGKIGRWRQGQANIQHLTARRDQAQSEGLLDRQGIGPIVVTNDDLGLTQLVNIGAKPQP